MNEGVPASSLLVVLQSLKHVAHFELRVKNQLNLEHWDDVFSLDMTALVSNSHVDIWAIACSYRAPRTSV